MVFDYLIELTDGTSFVLENVYVGNGYGTAAGPIEFNDEEGNVFYTLEAGTWDYFGPQDE